MIIAVAGCVAQAEGAEILRRVPEVDIVLGPQTYHRLPEMVCAPPRRAKIPGGKGSRLLDTGFPAGPKFDHLPETTTSRGVSAVLGGSGGLRQVLHLLRCPLPGAEFSRPVTRVVAGEAPWLRRAPEITLLGQNVNAYHGIGGDGWEWGLRAPSGSGELAPGRRPARILAPASARHDDLVAAHGEVRSADALPCTCRCSRPTAILAAMNRQPRVDVSTAFSTGCAGARKDIRACLIRFHRRVPGRERRDRGDDGSRRSVGFAMAYSFKYSTWPRHAGRRPGRPGAGAGQGTSG